MATTCEDELEMDHIEVINDSIETIYVIQKNVKGVYEPWSGEVFDMEDFAVIVPGESYIYDEYGWTANNKLKEDVLRHYIVITQSQIDNNSLDEIFENNIYEKHLRVNYAYLMKKNYKLIYPQDFE